MVHEEANSNYSPTKYKCIEVVGHFYNAAVSPYSIYYRVYGLVRPSENCRSKPSENDRRIFQAAL